LIFIVIDFRSFHEYQKGMEVLSDFLKITQLK